jgi:nicotinate phosphoribosyltransferase
MPVPLYGQSLALLTDLYQLTMAYGYWKLGRHQQEAVFHLTFRRQPFNGGYSIACGLEPVIDYLQQLQFDPSDLDYLATLTGNDGQPIFDRAFLDYLGKFEFSCDLDAMPEGTVVFPHEPVLRVRGPMLQCQLLETPLLNIINFQTLIATKAARVAAAAKGDPVLEFGLRRAQGIDGSLSASRAAFIGGCSATSNVLAGKLFGIPVKGTHAHSWVMSFDDELESFEAYASAMPNNCVFLVDTYDTLDGVRHAATVGAQLKKAGHKMIGIRLDSGDLAYLSIEARKILDDAGLTDAIILASNDLDEQIITSLKQQGATIAMWGVGTKLVTAYDQPALGGVYKLGAIRDSTGEWIYKLKLSEQSAKISTPGVQQVRRFFHDGTMAGDAIYDLQIGIGDEPIIVDPNDPIRQRKFTTDLRHEDLLIPIFRDGKRIYDFPPLAEIRQRTQKQLETLHPTIKRIINPHLYPVGLEQKLHSLKNKLIAQVSQFRS